MIDVISGPFIFYFQHDEWWCGTAGKRLSVMECSFIRGM